MPAGMKKFVFLFIAMHFMLAALSWEHTWDDSAITLGLSKNLVLLGDMRPGLFSDRVDCTSSFLWMALNSAGFVLHRSPDLLLLCAKAAGLLLNAVNIVLLYMLLGRALRHKAHIGLGLFVFCCAAITVIESRNGMETPLYLTIVLASYLLYQPPGTGSKGRYACFIIVSSMMVFIRHEGPLYLLPFFLWECASARRHALRRPHLWIWALLALAYHLWHYSFFGSILTNPMIAKQHAPYTPSFGSLLPAAVFHVYPLWQLALTVAPLLAVCALVLISGRALRRGAIGRFFSAHGLACMIVGFGVLFNLAIGINWGPTNRMAYPVLPFVILLLLLSAEEARDGRRLPGIVIILAGLLFVPYQLALHRKDMPNMPPVAAIRHNARLAGHLRALSGKDKIIYAGPDMGGVVLFGRRMRVVDTGLLCNTYLARHGYDAFEEYVLVRERPDIIETHGVWTLVSGIYRMEDFYARYVPLRIDCTAWGIDEPAFAITQFYIRKSLLRRLPPGSAQIIDRPLRRLNGGVPYYGDHLDRSIQTRFGRHVFLKMPPGHA